MRKNKYGSLTNSKKPRADGYVFDSKPEYLIYLERRQDVKDGVISELKVHPKFVLEEPTTNKHGQKIGAWNYTADFSYTKDGIEIVEDVKGYSKNKPSWPLIKKAFMRRYKHKFFLQTNV